VRLCVPPPPPLTNSARQGVDEKSPNVVARINVTQTSNSKHSFSCASVRPLILSVRKGVDEQNLNKVAQGNLTQTNNSKHSFSCVVCSDKRVCFSKRTVRPTGNSLNLVPTKHSLCVNDRFLYKKTAFIRFFRTDRS
jgi:hypothetical protein